MNFRQILFVGTATSTRQTRQHHRFRRFPFLSTTAYNATVPNKTTSQPLQLQFRTMASSAADASSAVIDLLPTLNNNNVREHGLCFCVRPFSSFFPFFTSVGMHFAPSDLLAQSWFFLSAPLDPIYAHACTVHYLTTTDTENFHGTTHFCKRQWYTMFVFFWWRGTWSG